MPLLPNAVLDVAVTAVLGAALYAAPGPLFTPRSVPFGVRVPPDRVADPAVAAARRRYRTLLAVSGVAAVLLALGLDAAAGSAAAGSAGGGLVLCVLAATLWVRAHRGIAAAKTRGDWYGQVRQGAAADTSLRSDPVRFPVGWLLAAVAVVAATAAAGLVVRPHLPSELAYPERTSGGTAYRTHPTTVWSVFGPVFVQAAVTAAAAGLVAGVLRARPGLDAARPRGSAWRHRRFLRSATRALLGTAALVDTALLGLCGLVWSGSRSAVLALLVAGLPGLGVLAVAAHLLLRVGPGGSRLAEPAGPPEETGLVPRDDDRFWRLAGTVYVNAADPAVLVPRRAGLGWTANLGNRRLLAGAADAVVAAAAVAGALLAR